MDSKKANIYSVEEENYNVLSHFVGLVLSVVALFLLLAKSLTFGSFITIFSSAVFGLSAVCLYLASTLYHNEKNEAKRLKYKVFDHCSIYILIAGSYTPFSLISLQGSTGKAIFISVWGIAIVGIILKFFFTGKLSVLSTISYVAMGWIIIFAFKPLSVHLPSGGMLWLVIGGIAYTLGAALYQFKKMKFNHAIFHLFTLVGTISHFIAIYFYVI